jgi:hypothetical protein
VIPQSYDPLISSKAFTRPTGSFAGEPYETHLKKASIKQHLVSDACQPLSVACQFAISKLPGPV